jgi:hypothetical protein
VPGKDFEYQDLYAGGAQFLGQVAVANPVKGGAKGPSCGALAEDDLLVFNLDPVHMAGTNLVHELRT